MSEVNADVLIVETGETGVTPCKFELDPEDYTLQVTYEGQTQERTTTVAEGKVTREDFDFEVAPPPPRKGLPSESPVMTITYHPKIEEGESTVLTLNDKPDYFPGETVTLSSALTFKATGDPLDNREIILYEDGVEKMRGMTDASGTCAFEWLAPEVDVDTPKNYQAKFIGDI